MESACYARYYKTLAHGSIRCNLCAHACLLLQGETGFCGTRSNCGGELINPLASTISSVAIDPIEKKPLAWFLPGSMTFSVGFWHCSFHCPFCQNWEIAHPLFEPSPSPATPLSIIRAACDSGCPSISFTYSEPTIHFEFLADCLQLAKKSGLSTVLVTNGNLLPEPASEILPLIDAINVDLKTSSSAIYRDLLHGSLEVVKNFIRISAKKTHTEVTSLLVPGVLDHPEQMAEIAQFLATIDTTIPLHITRYHPAHTWNRVPLAPSERLRIAAPAFDFLTRVHFQKS